MDVSRLKDTVSAAAAEYAVSETEFVSEIESAIRISLDEAAEKGDLKVLSEWQRIPCAGGYPTAYEIIGYLCEEVYRRLQEESD